MKGLNDNIFFLFFVVDITDDVGRTRLGKETLYNSVCREREANAPPRRECGCGRSAREGAECTSSRVRAWIW